MFLIYFHYLLATQFILQHLQSQQHFQQQTQDSSHPLSSSDQYPIYSSNHLDARPIPTFFTQTQKPHFLFNLLQGFQQPWALTTSKPTYVYMNSRPHGSQTMSTSQPDVIVRPAVADSAPASSQTVSQTTGFRGKLSAVKAPFYAQPIHASAIHLSIPEMDTRAEMSKITSVKHYGYGISCWASSSVTYTT